MCHFVDKITESPLKTEESLDLSKDLDNEGISEFGLLKFSAKLCNLANSASLQCGLHTFLAKRSDKVLGELERVKHCHKIFHGLLERAI